LTDPSPFTAEAPIADIDDEAERILEGARREGLSLRLLGGAAVARLAPDRPAPLRRTIGDLDVVTDQGSGSKVERMLVRLGYRTDTPFNIVSRPERLRLLDDVNNRHVDVFVGKFRMCHEIPFATVTHATAETISVAELLLTKLQIARLTEKDITDVFALLHAHDVGGPTELSIATLCAGDWGLSQTVLLGIDSCRTALERSGLVPADRRVVAERLTALGHAIEQTPKSRRWKLRARIGTRLRWYELPEEVP
jgi:hypothetical protein